MSPWLEQTNKPNIYFLLISLSIQIGETAALWVGSSCKLVKQRPPRLACYVDSGDAWYCIPSLEAIRPVLLQRTTFDYWEVKSLHLKRSLWTLTETVLKLGSMGNNCEVKSVRKNYAELVRIFKQNNRSLVSERFVACSLFS